LVTTQNAKVLFGDSTPSSLPADILDVVLALVLCVREVGQGIAEITDLLHKCDEVTDDTGAIVAELDAFVRQSEIGLRATAVGSKRPEIAQHGEEAIAAVRRMVDGWRRQYLGQLEKQTQHAARRTDEIQAAMTSAVERFLLPRRFSARDHVVRRTFDGAAYRDTATVEPVAGIRLELTLQDSEPEVPRKLRSLLPKGSRLQIGTKLSRIRRTEEPAFVPLDDLVIVAAEVSADRVRVDLTKRPGVDELIQLELVSAQDGMRGAGKRSDGVRASLPITDRPVMDALFATLQQEARRAYGGPATVTKIVLEGEEIDGAGGLLELAQRLVDLHRPMIADLANKSPNPSELSIKIDTADGRREEHWVRREDLARHLLALPASVLARLTIPELYPDMALTTEAGVPEAGAIKQPHAGADSERIDLGAIAAAIPAAPVAEVTEDISLHDLLLDQDNSGVHDDVYAGPTRVRSRR
jgi:hypothetical protein